MADRETDDGGSYPGMYGEETEAKLIRYISAAAQLMAAKFLFASALSCRYSLESGGPAEVSRISRMQLQSKCCGEEGEICCPRGHPNAICRTSPRLGRSLKLAGIASVGRSVMRKWIISTFFQFFSKGLPSITRYGADS